MRRAPPLPALSRCLLAVAFSLLGLATVLAADSPARSLHLNPLPQSLAQSAAPAHPARSDPRVSAFSKHLSDSVHRLRAQTMAAPGILPPRRSGAGGAPRGALARKATPSRLQMAQAGTRAPLAAPAAAAPGVRMRGGSVRWLRAVRNGALQAQGASDEDTVRSYLRARRGLMGLTDPDRELQLRTRMGDALGHRHLRFRQSYSGLPVSGAELVAQLDASGRLVSLYGGYAPTPRKLVTRPSISQATADRLIAGLYPGSTRHTAPELLVYPRDDGTSVLGWRYTVTLSPTERRVVILDAHRGTVVLSYNEVETVNAGGSGTDLFGASLPLNVWRNGSTYYLADTSKRMFDPASTPPSPATGRGMLVVQDARHLPQGSPPEGSFSLTDITSTAPTGPWLADGVSAAANLSAVFDYYLSEHQRSSLDGMGGNILAVVRYGTQYQNAFYDSSTNAIYFGDAEKYAGALDVVGHELTHGVVFYTANLLYQGQSGALNEAYADIFGELIEAYTTGTNDWRIGTRITVLRDMANPGSILIQPGLPYPSTMSQYIQTSQDSGGVHLNSSIINHAFYLLAAGLPNAIGRTDAGNIFYRALTTKLTQRADFADARIAAIDSAEELFGAGSAQSAAVAAAFDAVQIFDTPSNPQPSPFPGVSGPDATLFVYLDDASGSYHLGRQETALGDPAQGVSLSRLAVARSRPAVSGDGSIALFVSASHDLCLIPTDGSQAEECLGAAGLVHSVAVTPDLSLASFILLDPAGNALNQINVVDIATGDAVTYDLVATAMDGTSNNTIVAADAMDFAASGRYLIYDAFNKLSFADGAELGLWSIYAIDLTTGATVPLVPPTVGYDVGNPAIAQTSDSHLVFDAYSQDTSQDVVLAANLLTGELSALAQAGALAFPGYTGNDRSIVYSKPDTSVSGTSLYRVGILADRLTPDPASPEALWEADADFGVVYRRGSFTGPASVDLQVSQTVQTQPPHRAIFAVKITNAGGSPASGITLSDVIPANASYTSATGSNATCAPDAGQISCTIPTLGAGASTVVQVELRATAAGDLQNAASVYASATDGDPSTNTSFGVAQAASLNAAPVFSGTVTGTSATEGAGFSLALSGHFSDCDGDTLSYSATGLPGGLSLDSTSGVISGTPAAGTARSSAYPVQVTATDTLGGAVTTTVNLSVSAPGSGNGGGGGGGGGGAMDPSFLAGLLTLGMWTLRRRARGR